MPERVALDSCDLKLVDPERVRAVQASLPDGDVVDELAEVFGLLSDPNRLRLMASQRQGRHRLRRCHGAGTRAVTQARSTPRMRRG